MRERIVISACIVLLMGGPALAEDAGQACVDQLSQTESLVDETVNSKALDEGDVEEVNWLLDEADTACTNGDYEKAKTTLAKVKTMLKEAPAPAAAAEETAQ
ncbi:hypothetical protein AUC68_08590 [Methyloceanibacter methanicus]|uniref:Uncharacterized protein n=1 Tax=Methyloceanibacter methanicus TaxID=1774968 RepID=A0A1E3VY55_9HYPH|nr:hypothetical protein [Methyloceanibacter methanicus]ODR98477.1 hypothetical protein AUC68_08590 [Methyloceanibacter methanicus]